MQLTDMTWPAINALDRNTPVVIPVAALEQHGHHLPLFTDSMLLGEVIRRASDSMHDRVLLRRSSGLDPHAIILSSPAHSLRGRNHSCSMFVGITSRKSFID